MAMQILIINLDVQLQRLQYQQQQLWKLGLTFQRLPAFDAKQAQQHPVAPGYWDTWQRPLTWQERACLLSHQKAWEHVRKSGQPALILEDDAVVSVHLPQLLQATQRFENVDHISLEYRGRKKLIAQTRSALTDTFALHRLYLDRTGAAAYILWPNGARKLLFAAQQKCALADAMICQSATLQSYQVVPAAAIQLDMLASCGGTNPEYAKSSIGDSPGRSQQRTLQQSLRRILAQLQMGWRQVKALTKARRTHIPVDTSLTLKVNS